jgi:hypothetical protein
MTTMTEAAATTTMTLPPLIVQKQIQQQKEKRRQLKQRLLNLQNQQRKVQQDRLTFKMKAEVTVASLQLELQSMREDRQIMIEKCMDLKSRIVESQTDLSIKLNELETLKQQQQQEQNSDDDADDDSDADTT